MGKGKKQYAQYFGIHGIHGNIGYYALKLPLLANIVFRQNIRLEPIFLIRRGLLRELLGKPSL